MLFGLVEQTIEGRPKTQSSVLIIVEQGEVKVDKSCARKERASAAQATRKVAVLKGFMY